MKRLVAAALVVGLAACSGGEPERSWGREEPAKNVQLPETGPAAAFSSFVVGRIKAAGTVRSVATGTLSAKRMDAESTARLSGDRVDWTADIRFEGGGRPAQIRHVAGIDYLSFGGPFAKAEQGSPMTVIITASAAQAELLADPVALPRLLKVAGEVRRDGSESAVTKYVTALDLARAVSAGTSKTRMVLQRLVAEGVKMVQVVYWLGDTGLPAKVQITAETAKGATFAGTATYSGWGEPVDIKAPSREEMASVPTRSAG